MLSIPSTHTNTWIHPTAQVFTAHSFPVLDRMTETTEIIGGDSEAEDWTEHEVVELE